MKKQHWYGIITSPKRIEANNYQVVVRKIHIFFVSQTEAFAGRDYVSFIRTSSTLSTNI